MNLRLLTCSLILVLTVIGDSAEVPSFPRIAPVAPADAPVKFHALDGFHMELLAAEPLVTSPVAMAYDENGLAYVAEMVDYPYTNKATHQPYKENTTDKPIGRIRVLEDTKGTGVFDKSYILADGLSWPTGVACYNGGVYVIATPDLWYFKTTKGDHKADIRRKVFTGFRKFNIQAVANNLIWGLDNKIYGAGGSNGGTIVHVDHPEEAAVPIPRNDFRFDPVTEKFEAIPGGARFGNTFDDWGNRFVCNIRNPAQHVVFESHYLSRNPYLPVASALSDVAESGDAIPVYRTSPLEAWRDLRGRRWSTDGTVIPRSELVAGGVVTSSSGVTIYRGDAYPPAFRNQFFLAEPASNLVHRQLMAPAGITFTSHRIDTNVDFVSSTDIWCRPVNFTNAPDGTLHVIDMYREVIEHPWSIPDDIRDKLDLESGRDRGRIYRLAPPNFRPPKPPRLGPASISELVSSLENHTAWWRETAQRLLVERHDRASIPLLRSLLRESNYPQARLHALWTLQGLGAVGEEDILQALADASPGVRENAIKVAERHLGESPHLLDKLLPMADDMQMRVRFQTALTLGESDDPRVTDALASILRRDIVDPWTVTAVLSSAATRSHNVLSSIATDTLITSTPQGRETLRSLALVVGARNKPNEIGKILTAIGGATPRPAAMSVLAGLGAGLKRNHKSLRQAVADPNSDGAVAISLLLSDAYSVSADDKSSASERVAAIALLGLDDFDHAKATFDKLLDAHQPQEVQRAAIAAMTTVNHDGVGPLLLAHWASYTPLVRGDAVAALVSYKNRILPLFSAIDAGKVSIHDIPAVRRSALKRSTDHEVQARAEKLFATEASLGRKEVIARYMPAAQLKGDSASGHKVYQAICIACHRMGTEGNDVGPNLATVRLWSPEQILVNVIDPNREVAPAFVEYIIETRDGETLSGIIADETASSITLKWSAGQTRTLSRQDIRKISASRISLMPEGLEASISVQQMADVIAFLRGEH